MARPVIIFVPGMKPKPPADVHLEALRRCLLEGLSRVDETVAADLAAHPEAFVRASWTYGFYQEYRDIGIDLESRARDINLPGLVRHILNASEAAEFRALPAAVRHQAILTIWTRKEAWIKALGEGLSRPLKSFSVPVDPGVTEQITAMTEAPGKTVEWTFRLLDAHPDDIATLTARGADWTCRCLDWQPEETA